VSKGNEETLKPPSGSFLSVYPPNSCAKLSNRLQITSKIHGIPINPTTLGAYATRDLNTSKALFS